MTSKIVKIQNNLLSSATAICDNFVIKMNFPLDIIRDVLDLELVQNC